MAVSDDLGEVTDRLIGHYVDQTRRSGVSWSLISRGVGVREQAVRQRFAEHTADLFGWELECRGAWPGCRMERYTTASRRRQPVV